MGTRVVYSAASTARQARLQAGLTGPPARVSADLPGSREVDGPGLRLFCSISSRKEPLPGPPRASMPAGSGTAFAGRAGGRARTEQSWPGDGPDALFRGSGPGLEPRTRGSPRAVYPG